MYYISENKQDLENYNSAVAIGLNLGGTTERWASIHKHYNQEMYAIMANENYPLTLQIVNNIDDFINPNDLI